MPVAGLARALVEASARPSARLVPGGGFPGAPFPAEETYVGVVGAPAPRRRAGLGSGADGARLRRGSRHGAWAPGGRGRRRRSGRGSSTPSRDERDTPVRDVLALVPRLGARAVLDVGCGEGAFGASLEARGARVTGIELDDRAARWRPAG